MPASSANRLPSAGARPSHRAANTRRKWPWENTATGTGDRAQVGDHLVGTRPDLRNRLSIGDAIAPERPPGPRSPDLGGREPLVGAVIPLRELGPSLGELAEAGQPAGIHGPRQRAAENEREAPSRAARRRSPRPPCARARLAEHPSCRCACRSGSIQSRRAGQARPRVHRQPRRTGSSPSTARDAEERPACVRRGGGSARPRDGRQVRQSGAGSCGVSGLVSSQRHEVPPRGVSRWGQASCVSPTAKSTSIPPNPKRRDAP